MTGAAWRQYLQTYVALRRAIGFTMQREARLLQDFVDHLERRGDDAPVAQVAVEWASASTESQHAGRLSLVRSTGSASPRCSHSTTSMRPSSWRFSTTSKKTAPTALRRAMRVWALSAPSSGSQRYVRPSAST